MNSLSTILERLRNLELNIFQTLAVTGLVVSLVSQLGLLAMGKTVDTFWAVYVIWAAVLIISSVIAYEPHDHDHDHEH